jgi:ribosomal protein S18 acetylase RimI-like enzyme
VLPSKWESIVRAAFGDSANKEWTADFLMQRFVGKPHFDPRGFFFITTRSDVVGTCFCWVDDEAAKIPHGKLHFLAVHPAHARKGLGTALVRLVLHRLAERGFTSVVLRTEDTRVDAMRLYGREGGPSAAAVVALRVDVALTC